MYNVGPTSSTLVQHCTNVIQMFCVYWVICVTSWNRMHNSGGAPNATLYTNVLPQYIFCNMHCYWPLTCSAEHPFLVYLNIYVSPLVSLGRCIFRSLRIYMFLGIKLLLLLAFWCGRLSGSVTYTSLVICFLLKKNPYKFLSGQYHKSLPSPMCQFTQCQTRPCNLQRTE